ncbi:MAG: site-2 protease family protein [Chloroflexota bacterium]
MNKIRICDLTEWSEKIPINVAHLLTIQDNKPMFSSFQPTKYDLKFNIFGFSVSVHPAFWIIMAIFGYSGRGLNLTYMFTFIFVAFISILIHELGHGFAFRHYGIHSRIVLHGFGGAAIPESFGWRGGRLSSWQQIVISLAGPFSQLLLVAVVLGLVQVTGGVVRFNGIFPQAAVPFGGTLLNTFIIIFILINIFWALFNLLPIYPMDGGQAIREVFVTVDPVRGYVNSLRLSIATAVLGIIVALTLLGSTYMAILFGLFAYQNYQMMGR